MQRLFSRIESEARDALKSGNMDALVQCLRWVRDIAQAQEEALDNAKKSKEAESLTRNLDAIETEALINALGRRNKGLVVGELRDVEVGREGLYVSYRNGYTLARGITLRLFDHLEGMEDGGNMPDNVTEADDA